MATPRDFELARAGWLFRQSSILRRWKKNWFTLTTEGTLRYFDSPDDHMAQEAYEIPNELTRIKTGVDVRDCTLPAGDGYDRSCLFELELSDTNMLLCADSLDDMSAWQISLEQARVMLAMRSSGSTAPLTEDGAPPPYSEVGYNHQPHSGPMHYGTHPPHYVVQEPDGRQTVVIVQDGDRYYRRRGCDGGDMAVGMLAGAAMGSLMWGPLLFW